MTHKCNIIYDLLKNRTVFFRNFWQIPQNQVLLHPMNTVPILTTGIMVYFWMIVCPS